MTHTTYKVTREGENIIFEKTTLPENAVQQEKEGFEIAGEGTCCFYSEEGCNFVMGETFLVGEQVYLNYPDYMFKPISADFAVSIADIRANNFTNRKIIYR